MQNLQSNGLENEVSPVRYQELMDFNFTSCVKVKQLFYKVPSTIQEDIMKERIHHAFQSIDENITINVNKSLLNRLLVCYR